MVFKKELIAADYYLFLKSKDANAQVILRQIVNEGSSSFLKNIFTTREENWLVIVAYEEQLSKFKHDHEIGEILTDYEFLILYISDFDFTFSYFQEGDELRFLWYDYEKDKIKADRGEKFPFEKGSFFERNDYQLRKSITSHFGISLD